MLYDLTIILSRIIDYRYFYRTGISIVILYQNLSISVWDPETVPIAHMSTISFNDFDINDLVDQYLQVNIDWGWSYFVFDHVDLKSKPLGPTIVNMINQVVSHCGTQLKPG